MKRGVLCSEEHMLTFALHLALAIQCFCSASQEPFLQAFFFFFFFLNYLGVSQLCFLDEKILNHKTESLHLNISTLSPDNSTINPLNCSTLSLR